ncbi:MAG: peroxidase family protein [Neptuniibacter sp.]
MIPDHFEYQGGAQAFRQNHGFIEHEGLANILEAASQQIAGTISLGGVPNFMLPAERQMIEKGRAWGFNTYNAYREHFELKRLTSFDELTDDKALARKLEKLYVNIDRLELTVGLFAEKPTGKTLTGELQTTMVAYDAITQIYTNPLLATHNFTEQHFTRAGMDRIEQTNSFQDLVDRHVDRPIKVSVAFPNPDPSD